MPNKCKLQSTRHYRRIDRLPEVSSHYFLFTVDADRENPCKRKCTRWHIYKNFKLTRYTEQPKASVATCCVSTRMTYTTSIDAGLQECGIEMLPDETDRLEGKIQGEFFRFSSMLSDHYSYSDMGERWLSVFFRVPVGVI